MKDYSAMSDAEVNIEVAEIQYPESQKLTPYKHRPDAYIYHRNGTHENKDYCNNPADAWPIITENSIVIMPYMRGEKPALWLCFDVNNSDLDCQDGNPLRAAMIVFLMMKDAEKGHG